MLGGGDLKSQTLIIIKENYKAYSKWNFLGDEARRGAKLKYFLRRGGGGSMDIFCHLHIENGPVVTQDFKKGLGACQSA